MEIKKVKISSLKPHEDNPRTIDEFKFSYLKESITDFPQMLEMRPLVVNKKGEILCGNMRYLACKDLGYKEIHVKEVNLTDAQEKELMIKDNLSYGDWDWDAIEFNWDMDSVDKWLGRDSIDYSVLDYEDVGNALDGLHNGVKKAIQIKIIADHYETAKELEKKCRDNGVYIGGLFLEELHKIKLGDEKGRVSKS